MRELVTVVVSAGGSSERMLRTCLGSLRGYRNETSFKILLVTPYHQSEIPSRVAADLKVNLFASVEMEDDMSGSRVHAAVLDSCLVHVKTPYLLTMDADCFPISDGWLDKMMEEIRSGAAVSGIMHPYAPPPSSLSETTMEHRVRRQLCWQNTHVACQLVGVDTLKRLGVGFMDGDDTGLAIPVEARRMGMEVSGLKITGCAIPEGDEVPDPECNRSYCLVFGDMIYHHGGGSRENQGHDFADNFWGETRRRVIEEGAEFLLDGGLYRYGFDDEEKVAGKMVAKMLQGMQLYLKNHDRLFEE